MRVSFGRAYARSRAHPDVNARGSHCFKTFIIGERRSVALMRPWKAALWPTFQWNRNYTFPQMEAATLRSTPASPLLRFPVVRLAYLLFLSSIPLRSSRSLHFPFSAALFSSRLSVACIVRSRDLSFHPPYSAFDAFSRFSKQVVYPHCRPSVISRRIELSM